MLYCAISAAKEAGRILMDGLQQSDTRKIEKKGIGDYVTEIDRASEQAVIKIIKDSYPDHQIIAEESGLDRAESSFQWIIDPLDGTANYVHSIPVFGVSIGLMKDAEMIIGVVYSPATEELFWAERGKGAFLNGKKISVSPKKDFSDSMIATGFPWRSRHLIDPYLKSFREVLTGSAGVRRMGAAAIDLAYTACGRFEGFWEIQLKPWDIAAGSLLVKEAGGVVTDFTGKDDISAGNIVAGVPEIHKHIVEVTKKYLADAV